MKDYDALFARNGIIKKLPRDLGFNKTKRCISESSANFLSFRMILGYNIKWGLRTSIKCLRKSCGNGVAYESTRE